MSYTLYVQGLKEEFEAIKQEANFSFKGQEEKKYTRSSDFYAYITLLSIIRGLRKGVFSEDECVLFKQICFNNFLTLRKDEDMKRNLLKEEQSRVHKCSNLCREAVCEAKKGNISRDLLLEFVSIATGEEITEKLLRRLLHEY